MAKIRFHVQDEFGEPLVALVQGLSPVFGDWKGMTDAGGNFTADLSPGRYTGVISADGYVTRTIPWLFGTDGSVYIGLDVQGPPIPVPVPPDSADMIDLSLATIVNAPNVRDWKRTAKITGVSFDGSVSRIAFDKHDGEGRWPDVRPVGWTGDLQYTWWLFRKINGQWVGSAFIQMWFDRDGSGSVPDPDVPSLYAANWYYSSRWTPMYGSGTIQPGEVIGMMVTSGNQRDSGGPDSVQERSNTVTFAATDNGKFTW